MFLQGRRSSQTALVGTVYHILPIWRVLVGLVCRSFNLYVEWAAIRFFCSTKVWEVREQP